MVTEPDRVAEATSSSCDDFNTTTSSLDQRTDIKSKEPSPVSSLSPLPLNNENPTPSSLKKKLLTESTIYRRHEARLARSYALRDDPRPGFIRVLSGLPGFRMIFPPYQTESKKCLDKLGEQKEQEKPFARKVVPEAYSEETLFDRYSDAADNAVDPASTGINDVNDSMNILALERIMQAMLVTGFCSGTAEYVLAYSEHDRTKRLKYATSSSLSPFHNSNTAGSMTKKTKSITQYSSLLFRHKSSAPSNIAGPEIYEGYTREIPNYVNSKTLLKTTNKARPSTSAFSKALSAAFPTSLLFGTKVFLDSVLENQQNDNTLNHKNSHYVTNSILSSAFAGGMVGLSRIAFFHVKYRQQAQESSLSIIQNQRLTSGYSISLMGRNVLGAILYFSIYDGFSSISSTSKVSPTDLDTSAFSSSSSTVHSDYSFKRKGTLNIVMGGALAGFAHAAVMHFHRYGQYGSMIWWSRIMLPATTRAAPIHAFVFYGYEKIKEGLKTVT